MDIHPNNTLAQYITNLPRRISLHGEWECGLTEIHYPHDWYNVRNARMVVEHEESVHNVYLDDGYYDSPETLVEAINLDNVSRVKFSYDSVTQKVRAHLESQTKFRLYGDLSDILGFNNMTSDADHSITLPANSVVDLRRGFESLYVYSSMVEPRVVGDKIVPLLRMVPITGQHGEMVTTRFEHVQYIPVMSREFGTIETEIRDDTGRPVPFERGKVTVILHFRRHSTGLFRDELRRLLHKTGWRSVAVLYGCSCPEGAWFRKFIQRSPPISRTANKTRGRRAGKACTNNRCTNSRRRRVWSEYQEGDKTKSYSSRKSPDE